MVQAQFRLYQYWRSSASWRVRWAFAFKNIPCDFFEVGLLNGDSESPEHLARNPLGYVPVLEDLTTGHRMIESMAMVEYIEELNPNPPLLPGDFLQRAQIRSLCQVIASDTHPIQNLGVAEFHSNDPDEKKRWIRHWIANGLNAYETLISKTAGVFSVGDQLTMAELFLIPQCYNALRQEIDLNRYPTIERIHREALKHPSCIASHPDRFQPPKV